MKGTVIYLHGFLSSGASKKADVLRHVAPDYGWEVLAPDLNTQPVDVCRIIDRVFDEARQKGPVAFVGASLGGFYGAWIAQKTGCKAVLVNPAVAPWEVVDRYIGVHQIYASQRTIEVKPEFSMQLRKIDVLRFDNASRILLFLTTGDEVLDWQCAAKKYDNCPSLVIDGSDHMVSNFVDYADDVMRFLSREN